MQNKNAQRLFSGVSGQPYQYAQIDTNNPSPLILMAGNFIFAKDKGDDMDIIYIGESESIYEVLTATRLWHTAQSAFGADLLFGHPGIDPAARDAEKRDLVDQWRPPMNAAAE
jgi:hypothetical protein